MLIIDHALLRYLYVLSGAFVVTPSRRRVVTRRVDDWAHSTAAVRASNNNNNDRCSSQ